MTSERRPATPRRSRPTGDIDRTIVRGANLTKGAHAARVHERAGMPAGEGNQHMTRDPEELDGSSGYVAFRLPSSDQSDADQSAAEADRTASVQDEATSAADSSAAMEDQRASDRDQAAADRAHAAPHQVTADEQGDYEATRAKRQAVSEGRQRSRSVRNHTALLRRATAALRDRISRPRLRSSAIRKRLISEGVSPEMAVRWCDAWEGEADRLSLGHDDEYWSLGTQWIWAQRAAGRHLEGPALLD